MHDLRMDSDYVLTGLPLLVLSFMVTLISYVSPYWVDFDIKNCVCGVRSNCNRDECKLFASSYLSYVSWNTHEKEWMIPCDKVYALGLTMLSLGVLVACTNLFCSFMCRKDPGRIAEYEIGGVSKCVECDGPCHSCCDTIQMTFCCGCCGNTYTIIKVIFGFLFFSFLSIGTALGLYGLRATTDFSKSIREYKYPTYAVSHPHLTWAYYLACSGDMLVLLTSIYYLNVKCTLIKRRKGPVITV